MSQENPGPLERFCMSAIVVQFRCSFSAVSGSQRPPGSGNAVSVGATPAGAAHNPRGFGAIKA
jgi:hypothetical protein